MGFLLLVTIFGAGEKLACRGYLFDRIRKRTGGKWSGTVVALVITLAAFGPVHTWQNLSAATGTAISGLVFGCAFVFSRYDV